jgi:hypothetical protein
MLGAVDRGSGETVAEVQAGGTFPLDFRGLSVGALRGAATYTRTATLYTIDYGGGNADVFSGTGLAYNGGGDLSGGTITGFSSMRSGALVGEATGLSTPGAQFTPFLLAGDTQGALGLFLSGADHIVGFAFDDYLQGFAGADTIDGGAGADSLVGGPGNDVLDGGDGLDIAIYAAGSAGFSFARSGLDWQLTDSRAGAPEGVDLLVNVERVQFNDRFVDLTLSDPVENLAGRNILRTDTPSAVSMLVANSLLGAADATAALVKEAAATSSVATLAYEFFTGKIPSAAGMDFLVSPTGPNPNNLNSAYYQNFNLENRYINFAVNLGKTGEGAATFNAGYGALDLFAATKKAYGVVFGGTPTDAKVHAILDPLLVLDGASMTRAQYFAAYGGDGANGIGTKAAMVGYLLAEAVKADLGMYAKSNDLFLTDAAHGTTFNVDIVGVYGRPEFNFGG